MSKQEAYSPSRISLLTVLLIVSTNGFSQELEPRSMVNVPVGTSFAMLGYAYAYGNILFDPALPLEDVNARTHALVGAYVRSVNFFGMAAKANVIVPYAMGNWEGNYLGTDTTTSRSGMGDLRFGFSFNFTGAPALKSEAFSEYEQGTISGFSLQVVAPTGQYYEDKLINLGSNRWAFRPQLGLSHRIDSWHFEFALNAWIFTENKSFWDGNTMRQNLIGTLKTHVIKSFKNNIWLAFGAGYAYGGRTIVNDVEKDSKISVMRMGLIAAFPLAPHHSLKLSALSGIRFEQGADFDAFNITYQYVWIKK